ncbi:hypothetical protein LY78DRAFT_687111 [Colletotrichum sublineola]|nr:hypothetical protein LY78DRAFT_687111 [Colletotrichum sublineola]
MVEISGGSLIAAAAEGNSVVVSYQTVDLAGASKFDLVADSMRPVYCVKGVANKLQCTAVNSKGVGAS